MNEFLVLFILKVNKANIYEIKKFIDVHFASFMQISSGAIIPTLKKLEQNKFITYEKVITDGGLRKTIYSILPKGEDYFNTLLKEHDDVAPQTLRREVEIMFLMLNHKVLSEEQNTFLKEKIRKLLDTNAKTIEKAVKNEIMNVEFLKMELDSIELKKRFLI